jgi:deoxyribodipyrimidine photolyase
VDACIHAFQTLGFLPRSYLKFLIGFATKLWQLPWRWLFQWYLQHVKVGESLVEESTFLYYSGIGESQITIVPFRLHHLITRLDPTGKFQKAWVPEIAHLSPIQLQRFPYFALSEKRKLAPSYMKQVPEKVANLSYSLLEKTYPQRIASAIQSSSFQKWLSPFLRTRKKGVNSILHDP